MRFNFSVASKSDKNLMSVSNLGVCFGPTLLRPEEETVAAILNIKFCNIVVEIMIENYEKIFKSQPEANVLTHMQNNVREVRQSYVISCRCRHFVHRKSYGFGVFTA